MHLWVVAVWAHHNPCFCGGHRRWSVEHCRWLETVFFPKRQEYLSVCFHQMRRTQSTDFPLNLDDILAFWRQRDCARWFYWICTCVSQAQQIQGRIWLSDHPGFQTLPEEKVRLLNHFSPFPHQRERLKCRHDQSKRRRRIRVQIERYSQILLDSAAWTDSRKWF